MGGTGVTIVTDPLALIIEDDDQLAYIFSMAFQEAKFETDIVQNGQLALDYLADKTPSTIILDMHLPQVSGKKILQYIRSQAHLKETCVLLATADPGMAEMLQDEVDLVLIKPISFVQLRDFARRFRPKSS